MGQVVALEGGDASSVRAAAAKRIRKLSEDLAHNTIDLGGELKQARDTFPTTSNQLGARRPGWHKWLENETEISHEWASTLIRIFETFGHGTALPSLPLKVLGYLSGRDITKEERDEIVTRAETGEIITQERAKKIVEEKRLPSPKAANAQAKEEGRPVLASDGYIYFGTDPAKAKRTMVFGVRRSLETLAGIELTGLQFLQYAMPHQLWTKDEGKVIKNALRWLTSLDAAWDKWEQKI